jgi:hypothetical protein
MEIVWEYWMLRCNSKINQFLILISSLLIIIILSINWLHIGSVLQRLSLLYRILFTID